MREGALTPALSRACGRGGGCRKGVLNGY